MPRSYQGVKTPTGQAYGRAQDQQAAQKAIPLPQDPAAAPAPQQQGQPDLMALVAQMQGGGVPLAAPSERPQEPVTAGLPFGPGAGPEAISSMFAQRRNQTADVLDQVAAWTGDPRMQEMAQRARMQG
jgi:hypothetical protein